MKMFIYLDGMYLHELPFSGSSSDQEYIESMKAQEFTVIIRYSNGMARVA